MSCSNMANTSSTGSGKAPSPGVKKPPILSTSWSFTDNEPDTKYDHAWSIANFTRKMDMENGEELKSGVFSIRTKDRQTDWFMRINPNGEEKTCKGFVSLFLYKDGVCEVPINADIIFSIVDKEGVKTRAKRCEYTFEKNLPSDNRGFAKFVSHSELRHPQLNLLPGDTLTILCEISITGDNVVTSGTSKPFHGRVGRATEPVSRLSLDISSIFETGKFADCTVACEGREFRCHKIILAGRSTVFDAMFNHDTKENRTSRVDIEDLDGETVHDMLMYIYSGKVGELEGKATGLLAASEKYDLPELKEMCETSLCKNITTENALDLLAIADLYRAAKVRSLAHKFIVDHGREVAAHAGAEWKDKLKVYPELMADLLEVVLNLLPGEWKDKLKVYPEIMADILEAAEYPRWL